MTAALRLPLLDVRPRTRGECADVPRPCPWASCRHSLLVDIDAHGHAHEVEIPDESTACALDIADGGESTLEDIAELAGVTRERIRQIEAKAFEAIRGRRGKVLAELVDEGRTIEAGRSAGRSRSFDEARESPEPRPERRRVDDDYTAGMKVSFFAEGDGADELVTDMVWRLFAKDSTARGFDARSAASKRMTEWRKNNPTRGPKFVAFAKKKAKEATTMADMQMAPRLEKVLAAYEAGTKDTSAIAEKLGITHASAGEAMWLLRKHGKVPPYERSKTPASERRAPKRVAAPTTPASIPQAPPPPRTILPPAPGSPAEALRADLDACERRASALRKAIAALEEGGLA